MHFNLPTEGLKAVDWPPIPEAKLFIILATFSFPTTLLHQFSIPKTLAPNVAPPSTTTEVRKAIPILM
jgi:hypothetical protein